MTIGTLIVKNMQGGIEFKNVFCNLSMNNGRLYFQMEGSFFAHLPLAKDKLYKLQITGIPAMENQNILATYEDYIFNAGSTDYTDQDGVYHTGVCVLSNQLQFMIIPQ